MSAEPLLSFRYHPNPPATGSIVPRDEVCVACGRLRGFTYVGLVHAASDLDERLCPWCIADGTAAEQDDAEFTDVGHGVADDVPNETLLALSKCSPGFTGWQQERWLYHCGDATAFLGRANWHELQQYPSALDMLEASKTRTG